MIENQEHTDIEIGSNRSFGIVFFVVFGLIGLYPLIGDGRIRIWAVAIAGAFLVVALFIPRILAPLNGLWFRIGLLLSKIINPIVMLVIYVTAMLPIGLIMRGFGKDPLRRKFDGNAESYWISRDPAGPEPESFIDQF